MSRATAAVRFPDGSVRFGIYNGTTDIMWRHLFDTVGQAWDAWEVYHRGDGTAPETPEVEDVWDVDIYSDYGNGFWWRGTATRSEVIGPTEWPDDGRHDGRPQWFSAALSDTGGEG